MQWNTTQQEAVTCMSQCKDVDDFPVCTAKWRKLVGRDNVLYIIYVILYTTQTDSHDKQIAGSQDSERGQGERGEVENIKQGGYFSATSAYNTSILGKR